MLSRIKNIGEKKLVGKKLKMSLANNKTAELWKSFMIERSLVRNRVNSDYISMQVYNNRFDFNDFNPHLEFEKWAVVEVSDYYQIPKGMETYDLKGGAYAVFIHKGDFSSFRETLQFIYGEWLPNSEYVLDNREHFEILGEKYKNNDPASEEEVWIPIKKK